MSSYEAVIRIALIFLWFALIHSFCVTSFVKTLAAKILGKGFVKSFYRLLYTGVSLATTFIALSLILKTPDLVIWQAPFYLEILMRIVQLSGLALGIYSLRTFDNYEFMGLKQAWRFMTSKEAVGDVEGISIGGISSKGAYSIVRHPLYLAGLLIFTFNPDITRNWLTVSVLADLYFIWGAFIEETRLIEKFGDEYREYQKQVPMFIPAIRKK